jgi:hypothetical protein
MLKYFSLPGISDTALLLFLFIAPPVCFAIMWLIFSIRGWLKERKERQKR